MYQVPLQVENLARLRTWTVLGRQITNLFRTCLLCGITSTPTLCHKVVAPHPEPLRTLSPTYELLPYWFFKLRNCTVLVHVTWRMLQRHNAWGNVMTGQWLPWWHHHLATVTMVTMVARQQHATKRMTIQVSWGMWYTAGVYAPPPVSPMWTKGLFSGPMVGHILSAVGYSLTLHGQHWPTGLG